MWWFSKSLPPKFNMHLLSLTSHPLHILGIQYTNNIKCSDCGLLCSDTLYVVLQPDTDILEEHADSTLRVELCRLRNWLGYVSTWQERWSLRPKGEGERVRKWRLIEGNGNCWEEHHHYKGITVGPKHSPDNAPYPYPHPQVLVSIFLASGVYIQHIP
jgi:hypothetical protein